MTNKIVPKTGKTTQWKVSVPTNEIANPRVGLVGVYSVQNEENKELFKAIALIDAPGNVIFVINELGQIALVENYRHMVMPIETLAEIWHGGVAAVQSAIARGDVGTWSLEIPRGFNATRDVLKGGEEETQRTLEVIEENIGHINPNTGNCITSPWVTLAKASKMPATRAADPNENIRKVLWVEPEELMNHNIFCGFSLAAITLARHHLKKSENDFLREVGERM